MYRFNCELHGKAKYLPQVVGDWSDSPIEALESLLGKVEPIEAVVYRLVLVKKIDGLTAESSGISLLMFESVGEWVSAFCIYALTEQGIGTEYFKEFDLRFFTPTKEEALSRIQETLPKCLLFLGN
jgi:hypothetical protein